MTPLGHDFSMVLPGGRGRNPVTRTNWEGRGVAPDVATPRDEALKTALQRLGKTTPPVAQVDALSQARLVQPRTIPQAGAEAVLRRQIETWTRGQPDYDQMTPALAEIVRKQLPNLQGRLAGLGALQSVAFRAISNTGFDLYEVKFANGAVVWTILVAADGKLVVSNFRSG